MPLPIFPVFERLSDTSRVDYQHFYGRLSAPYCDFSLNNVLIWLDQKGDLELSTHSDCVVLRFASPFENNRRRYALFGTGNVDGAIREVLEFMHAQGEDVGLCMVPEETVKLIGSTHGLHVTEEGWNADYVIRIESTLGLKGRVRSSI
ncbi:MAG: hypothetical protein HYZ40_13990 [Rhodospirillales bacterium]|nr:hypothetical protein [Rhodospirillales bacterium]